MDNTPISVLAQTRDFWLYRSANWRKFKQLLCETDWRWIDGGCANMSAAEATRIVLDIARRCITRRTIRVQASHPWMDEHCLELVLAKASALGTPQFADATRRCSAGLFEAHGRCISRVRERLRLLPRGSKRWWRLSQHLFGKPGKPAIPSLCDASGCRAVDPADKANVLANCFAAKWEVPELEFNEFSTIAPVAEEDVRDFLPIRTRSAAAVLRGVRENSSTGPDGLSTRILRECAGELSVPMALLARSIIRCGVWPKCWCSHWVCPLHKKRSVHDPENYRGLQLTPHISKAM